MDLALGAMWQSVELGDKLIDATGLALNVTGSRRFGKGISIEPYVGVGLDSFEMEAKYELTDSSGTPIEEITVSYDRNTTGRFTLGASVNLPIVKPFEPLELVARIKACLRRVRPGKGEQVSVGEITIDRSSMTVTCHGTPVELTPKEYQLLCLFAEHPGEVLSREVIRKHLWKDRQIYSWSRVIDVHVQHLRRKIEKDPADPRYVKTIVGVGYRFETS